MHKEKPSEEGFRVSAYRKKVAGYYQSSKKCFLTGPRQIPCWLHIVVIIRILTLQEVNNLPVQDHRQPVQSWLRVILLRLVPELQFHYSGTVVHSSAHL